MRGLLTAEYLSLAGPDAVPMAKKIEEMQGIVIAHPRLAIIEVATVDAKIAGYGVSQLMFHAEPIYVLPEYRGSGIAEELASRVVKRITEANGKAFVSIATNPFAERLCIEQGMERVEGTLYRKQLG